ncbi:MAG: hypothetical protein ACRD0U_16560 [Acidimicrobiales bacterium]
MEDTAKPDPYETLTLLRVLAHAHAQADAYFETIGDAAGLAANQVQDVRLEHLEKGPTVTAADVVLELLLAVSLQYAGGEAVAFVTRAVMTRVLSSRRAVLLIAGRTETGDRIAATYKAANLATQVEAGVVAQRLPEITEWADVLLRLHGPTQLYTDAPFDIADLGTKILFHTARQVPQKPPRYTRLSKLDSPGVAVLDNAAQFVLRQQTFNKVVFDDLANIARLDLLSRDDTLQLIKDLDVYATGLYGSRSLGAIKQHFKLFFEACIWAGILNPRPRIIGSPPVLDVGKRGGDLTEYLLGRIVSPQTGAPFAESVRVIPPHMLPKRGEVTSERYVLDSLLDHFDDLRKATAEMEARLPPEGRTQWHYG